MAKIKFSVVVTVFNEEKSIEELLKSLFTQTLKPEEIIIVDAGSTDDTVGLIQDLIKAASIPIRVSIHDGVNQSRGRNIGIELAKNAHIAVIDAGCEADSDWLAELASGFTDRTQAVAGFYVPVISKPIQRLFAAYVSTLPRNLDETTFLPSSRSLAFTKEVWQKVGKYPEKLSTCEDLVFAVKLKRTGAMVVRRQALVLWHQVEGFRPFFNQIRGYARGDVEAGYMPHVGRIISVWARYVIFFWFPPLIIVYILYSPMKHYRETCCTRDRLWLPLIQFVSDAAVMWGSVEGLGHRLGLRSR